jgi:hypothetical protein
MLTVWMYLPGRDNSSSPLLLGLAADAIRRRWARPVRGGQHARGKSKASARGLRVGLSKDPGTPEESKLIWTVSLGLASPFPVHTWQLFLREAVVKGCDLADSRQCRGWWRELLFLAQPGPTQQSQNSGPGLGTRDARLGAAGNWEKLKSSRPNHDVRRLGGSRNSDPNVATNHIPLQPYRQVLLHTAYDAVQEALRTVVCVGLVDNKGMKPTLTWRREESDHR